jgi:putative transposase
MSALIKLRPNDVLVRNDVRFTVLSRSKDGMVNLLQPLENRYESVRDEELAAEYVRGEVHIDRRRGDISERVGELLDSDYADLTQTARDRAEQRLPYLQAIGNLNRRWSNKQLQKIIDQVDAEQASAKDELPKDRRVPKPSCRTVRRWIQRALSLGFDVVGDIRILVPRHYASGRRETEEASRVDGIVASVIDELVMQPTAATGSDALLEVIDRINVLNTKAKEEATPGWKTLVPPSRSKFYRLLQSISLERRMEVQYGKAAAQRKGGLFGRGPKGSKPLGQVEVDHTIMDVVVCHPETLVPIGRPTLTIVLDRWSRMILAVHVGLEPPGWRAAMVALRKAILPKSALLAEDPEGTRAAGTWPVMGVMDELILDNGLEFHCKALQDAALTLGIRLTYCPVRAPNMKGKVERTFRRANTELLHTIPGTTKSNPLMRGSHDSKSEARLTLKEVQGLLHQWVVDIYMRTVHTTTKETPLERWERGVEQMGGTHLPKDADAVTMALTEVEYRRLSSKGIELHGLIFSDRGNPHLREMLADPLRPKVVKVKVDPASIASVSVEDYRRPGYYYSVPCTDAEYARDMTLGEHEMVAARARDEVKDKKAISMPVLARAKAKLRADIKKIVDMRNSERAAGKATARTAFTRDEAKLVRLSTHASSAALSSPAAPPRPAAPRKPFAVFVEG